MSAYVMVVLGRLVEGEVCEGDVGSCVVPVEEPELSFNTSEGLSVTAVVIGWLPINTGVVVNVEDWI